MRTANLLIQQYARPSAAPSLSKTPPATAEEIAARKASHPNEYAWLRLFVWDPELATRPRREISDDARAAYREAEKGARSKFQQAMLSQWRDWTAREGGL